jgi:nicotinamide mononucleotide transporter
MVSNVGIRGVLSVSKLKSFVKKEISGWKPIEVVWLGFTTVVILALSIYWRDNAIGIAAALTGVWCVVLTGKGKVSNFLFGIVNVVLYAYISYNAKYYGEVMLNILYYLPCSVIGIVMWGKHMDEDSGEVTKKKLSLKGAMVVYPLTAIGVVVYGLILRTMGGTLPFVDSTSTVLSVVAQILCLKRFAEQWILWIVIDAVTVVMWAYNYATAGESIATLLMWVIYLLNAIFMYVKWRKDVK